MAASERTALRAVRGAAWLGQQRTVRLEKLIEILLELLVCLLNMLRLLDERGGVLVARLDRFRQRLLQLRNWAQQEHLAALLEGARVVRDFLKLGVRERSMSAPHGASYTRVSEHASRKASAAGTHGRPLHALGLSVPRASPHRERCQLALRFVHGRLHLRKVFLVLLIELELYQLRHCDERESGETPTWARPEIDLFTASTQQRVGSGAVTKKHVMTPTMTPTHGCERRCVVLRLDPHYTPSLPSRRPPVWPAGRPIAFGSECGWSVVGRVPVPAQSWTRGSELITTKQVAERAVLDAFHGRLDCVSEPPLTLRHGE